MKKSKIVLFENSKVNFSIFRLPCQSAEEIIEPADELVNYLEKSLAVKIPQYDKSYPIRLELFLDTFSKLEREEFIIDSDEKRISFIAGNVEAMFHAVYYFLENALGIRWLWPGETGEIVPKSSTLSWRVSAIREKPDFEWRAIQTKGAIHGDYEGIDWATMCHAILKLPLSVRSEFMLWARRNRLGGLKVLDGHRWSEIAPIDKYGNAHPEYYAFVNGKRDCQFLNGKHNNHPCLSNKEIPDLMAEYACSRFKSDPMLDVCSIAFNDGTGICECPECKRKTLSNGKSRDLDNQTDEFAGTGRTKGLGNLTDIVFANANSVAKKVSKKFPDKKLLILLYSNSRFAPRRKSLRNNVMGQFCIMGNSLWNKKILRSEKKLLNAISQKVPTLGIYEYYSNGKWPEIHRLFPELIEKSLNMYYNSGARYFATQPGMGFAINGTNSYILARLLWNRKLSAREQLNDYCEKGFGAASEEMKSYFSSFAEKWKETESATKLSKEFPEQRMALTELYPETFLNARRQELDTALKKVEGHEFRDRIKFVKKGFEYTALYCNALRQTMAVYRNLHGKKFSHTLYPWKTIKHIPDNKICRVRKALKAWDEYWNFIKENKGKFIFDDFWVNYKPGISGKKDTTIISLRERLDDHEKCQMR
ncbi:MAG: hypothetical protein A2017_18945 [Lentisphaerae bacterium GWF2_44_16]|nr:MAG: hypothetical protein A2017_18945 [Lentisphaerae bacterium GWF2_44_16]